VTPRPTPLTAARPNRTLGFLLVALSAACFGAMPVFGRGAYAAGADPFSLLLLRFGIAGAVLWLLVFVRRAAVPRGRTLGLLILMGAVGYVGQSLAYFTALTTTSASLLALILYLYPILVALLAAVVLKAPLTRTKQVALLLAVLGAGLTVGPIGGGNAPGVALGIAASLIYACYILALTRIAGGVDPLVSSAVITSSAAVVFLVLAAAQGSPLPNTGHGWLSIAAIALISTVVAVVAFLGGLARIGPTDTATVSTMEPVVTLLLAVALLGETLAPLQLVGGACILAAVVRLARGNQISAVPQQVRDASAV
jgi:drug/metabolite transporter (DMT)-like permease